ncbi:MAG: ferritin [Planctomycetia bacterium]|nr:ferritin [Planctomycetia bacterium]
MLSQTVQDALNDQINTELGSSYNYLAMSAYCERQNFLGCAHWLQVQSQEEYGHGMKIFRFMQDRNSKVMLKQITAPRGDFNSVVEVFESALEQEIHVSERINTLYELAFKEKAFAALVELQWFITEQVEEERTAREIVAKFNMVKSDPSAMLDLDRELAGRMAAAAAAPAA